MGGIEKSIAKQAMRAGQPLPDRIRDAPELRMGLGLYMQAFFDLDSERSHSMAPTAIPWTSMSAYAKAFDFDDEQTDDLIFFVRRMDADHLARIAKKMKA